MLSARHNSRVSRLSLAMVMAGVLCLAAGPQDRPQNPDDTKAQVANLVIRAMDEKDPVKKQDLAKQAILLDPNHLAAHRIYEQAPPAIAEKEKEQEQQKQEKDK